MTDHTAKPILEDRKPLIAAGTVALIIIIAALLYFYRSKINWPFNLPKATPAPAASPTTQERLKLLDSVPIKKDGEYTFEYLPKAKSFFLRIENSSRDKEIRKEIVELVKAATDEGDYCKFNVLVWSQDNKSTALPDC